MLRSGKRGVLAGLAVVLMLLSALLVSCKAPQGPDLSSPLSPLVAESPLATPTVLPEGVQPFALDEPLYVGATQVAGRGPAGLQIAIVDVTFAAEHLGVGEIGSDGTFAIEVKPLPESHAIGIMATDELPPKLRDNVDALWGPGSVDLPMVGTVFASAMTVKP